MNPALIAPDNPMGYPAPYWFLVLFKVLGFTLHMLPMNLWFAGIPVALLLRRRAGSPEALIGGRLMNAMPVVVACGVNLGIVPLLFTQVAYYKAFYPAGILMAWPWFAVIPLLTVAYYGVYVYALGMRAGSLPPWRRAAGWVASILFVIIGWLFVNNFSLMTRIDAWTGLWEATSSGGAVLGTALNLDDPTLWPRWLMVFGLALTTTAAWIAFDATVLAGSEGPHYRRSAAALAPRYYLLGLAWFGAAGAWYLFGALDPLVRGRLLEMPLLPLTALAAVLPALIGALLFWAARRAAAALSGSMRWWGVTILVAQVALLGVNAILRQVAQNQELSRHLDVTAEPVRLQASPLVLFLVLFVAGVVLVVWMLRQAIQAARSSQGEGAGGAPAGRGDR